MSGSYIYILGSHTGTLYIGVTSNLYLRVMQHKEGMVGRFHCGLWLQAPALL
jgi:predicted GIY-YIG superfamily endonuclease